MIKIIKILAFLIAGLSSVAFAQSTGGGGGPVIGSGTFSVVNPINYENNLRDTILSNQNEETSILKIERNEIEALMTTNGDYVRFEDIQEGFVRLKGVYANREELYLFRGSPFFNIESVIDQDGKVVSLQK